MNPRAPGAVSPSLSPHTPFSPPPLSPRGPFSPRPLKVRFPLAATPLWAVRFVVRTLAPVVVARVLALLPSLFADGGGSGGSAPPFPARLAADGALYGDLLTSRVREVHAAAANAAASAARAAQAPSLEF